MIRFGEVFIERGSPRRVVTVDSEKQAPFGARYIHYVREGEAEVLTLTVDYFHSKFTRSGQ